MKFAVYKWDRIHAGRDGRIHVGKALVAGSDDPIEIWVSALDLQTQMPSNWQERACRLAEERFRTNPIANRDVISLNVWEIENLTS